MLNRLQTYLQQRTPEGIALAFSGGVDSALLLAVLSRLYKENPFPLVALTICSVLQDKEEMSFAEKMAQDYAVPHHFIKFNPLKIEAIKNNHTDRCYHCKKAIFTHFHEYARQHGLKYILDGTNADDLHVYRPGQKALRELSILSPLAELGFTKTQIRRLSEELNLPTAAKPSVPCLATRFAYHTELTENNLNQVAAGEKIIRRLFPELKDFRLRLHGNLARLEVSPKDIPILAARANEITNALKDLGFGFVTLDLNGFQSGSFDRNITQNSPNYYTNHYV